MAGKKKNVKDLAENGQAFPEPKTFTSNGKTYWFLHSGETMWYGPELVTVDSVLENQEYLDQLVASESCLVKLKEA